MGVRHGKRTFGTHTMCGSQRARAVEIQATDTKMVGEMDRGGGGGIGRMAIMGKKDAPGRKERVTVQGLPGSTVRKSGTKCTGNGDMDTNKKRMERRYCNGSLRRMGFDNAKGRNVGRKAATNPVPQAN